MLCAKRCGAALLNKCLSCRVWTGRPEWPCQPTRVHPIEYAGLSTTEKLVALRTNLKEASAGALVLNDLAEIAWVFNMRGKDVDCNPVFVSYGIISADSATLYVAANQITAEVAQHLESASVAVKEYSQVRPPPSC